MVDACYLNRALARAAEASVLVVNGIAIKALVLVR